MPSKLREKARRAARSETTYVILVSLIGPLAFAAALFFWGSR